VRFVHVFLGRTRQDLVLADDRLARRDLCVFGDVAANPALVGLAEAALFLVVAPQEELVVAIVAGVAGVAIFSQGENPAVYGGRESDTC